MTTEEAMKILELSNDMAENIKKSYLRLSRENHPDTGGDPDLFKKINEAYLTLTEISPPSQSRNEPLNLNVEVSLEEAVFGVVLETHVKPTLLSSKPLIGDKKSTTYAQIVTIVENIPPMILLQIGSLTFSHKNQILNGSPRDININYSIKIHDRYKPHADKNKALLEVEESIPVTTALYGGTIEIKTLFGIRKIFITPGTDVGDYYEIKNHGNLGSLMVKISELKMPIIQELDSSLNKMQKKANEEIQKEEQEIEKNIKASGAKK